MVEHDEETMLNADWIIDLGVLVPESTAAGWWQKGRPEDIEAEAKSLTGAYLSGKKTGATAASKTQRQWECAQDQRRAREQLEEYRCHHSFGQIGLHYRCVRVGQIDLMVDILYNALARKLMRAHTSPGKHKGIDGVKS